MSRRLALFLLLAVGIPSIAEAQGGRGFLFREPRTWLGLRGGFGVASAGSDVFSFTTEELTVERSDFNGFSIIGDVGYRLAERLDLVGSLGYTGSVTHSESRRFEGTDDLPISQRVVYSRVPLTLGMRVYPIAPGRTVGSYAWVPAKLVPYLGGAVGGMWYRFRHEGEFVNEETLDIFNDNLVSDGWAPTAEAFGGALYRLTPRIALTGEGRYSWANADLSGAFEGFDPIDLAGFAVTVGVSVSY